jgi:hypothetical protein
LSGLNQIQKSIQNHLENDFENLEKEKEKDFSPHRFWPSILARPYFPH